jgi:hypothetical protein
MPDEEFRVEVDLESDEHHLSLGERLRALRLDDDARKRLGNQVTVTRDGDLMFLYTHTLEDAQEAERAVKELVASDGLSAEIKVTRWNPVLQEWTDPSGAVEGKADADTSDEADIGIPNPTYIFLEAYKPAFLRDFGL